MALSLLGFHLLKKKSIVDLPLLALKGIYHYNCTFPGGRICIRMQLAA